MLSAYMARDWSFIFLLYSFGIWYGRHQSMMYM